MSKTDSISLWRTRIQSRKLSGLNVKDWCEQNSISMHTYDYWNRKLNDNESIKQKLDEKKELSDEELMSLIILPLTQKGKQQKQAMLEQAISLAKEIENFKTQMFVISGIIVATDKFMEKEYLLQLKGWMNMTQLSRLYEEEKIEAVNEAVNKTMLHDKKEFAEKLISDGMEVMLIMKYTGLTRKQIEEVRDNMTVLK